MEEEGPPAKIRSPRSSGVIVPQQASWHGRLAAWLIYLVTRTLTSTVRTEWRDDTGLFAGENAEPVIFCTWHNRLALSLHVFKNYVQRRQPSRRLAALVSASKDGGLLARVLELYGVEPVRGSSSRRGPQALLELTSCSERGLDLAITPDGPRGPCYIVQDGVMALAQLTGRAIVPVSYHLSWKWRLKSWDRFQVPLPFTRCVAELGKPLRVPREISAGERDELRRQLEEQMKAMTPD